MASPQAILRAARAVSPTPAPQGPIPGLYPSMGQLPQHSTQPPGNYAYAYPPFLPRPPETFTSGAFGPFSPILPVPIDQPGPGLPRAQPRRWQPYVGYNLPVGQPGSEGYKLASFATLKALGEYYSIMRRCLEIRKNEIRSLDWDIVLTPEAATAYRGDAKAMRDFGERRAKAKKFFAKPDPNYFDFSSWLYAALEQVFVYDALSIYLCPKKGTGLGRGLLGSDLDCLWLIDGSSIRPLMGLHGERPAAPAPAAQQYEFGVPRADLAMMIDDRDLDGADVGRLMARLRGDQFLYLPYVPRVDSPYGFSLVEQGIIPIMTGLRKQAYQLEFFGENTVPAVYISPGDSSMTANQIRELQDALNAVAGDVAWRYKVIVLPPGSKTMPQKDIQIVDQSDEWIANEVAMVAGVNPMELGILPRVSTVASPFAAREMAQTQRSIKERSDTKPTLKYLTAIPDLILQAVCGQDDMRFLFSGMEQEADLAAQNDMDIKDVQSGIKAIDEVRDSRGLVPWGLPETTGPIVITQAGPLPLEEAADLARAQQAQNGQGQPVGRSSGNTGAHHAAAGATGRSTRAIPAGVSGVGRMNGPVTQRQARRGGALAPAHATAEGAPGHSGGKSAGDPGIVSKAASAELEALTRHLRKGRAISTWEPRHLPARALSAIAEDLAHGLGADLAVQRAGAILAKAATPPQNAAQQNQARRQQQAALAQRYATQIRAAFTSALSAAAKLIARWTAGALTVTLAALVAMVADLIAKALRKTLRRLWRDAWALGRVAAAEEAGGHPDQVRDAEALKAFLATYGEDLAGLISQTRMRQVQETLTALIRSGESPEAIVADLERLLRVGSRADTIAATEVSRAVNAAMEHVFRDAGIAYKQWVTSGLPNVCPRCLANQKQGPVPLGALFGSGAARPPQHPQCACRLAAFIPPAPTASKTALARRVNLNGQVTWEAATEPPPNAAGGGGPSPVRHVYGTGVAVPGGVPGMTAGGEPPRWDGTEPEPSLDGGVDGGDDGEWMGGPRGTGTPPADWPQGPYMDGYWDKWPQGGIGTGQAPISSPGGGGPRGRPPNAVGKAANAASFLAGTPRAKTAAVYAQLRENYPPASIAWVNRAQWHGPAGVPLDLIDWDGRKTWAADKQTSKVNEFARLLQAHEPVNPIVAVAEPGRKRYRIIDGHHRGLACRKLGWPVRAWIAETGGADLREALETHSSQVNQGDSPQNKSFTAGAGTGASVSGLTPFNLLGQGSKPEPYVAGLMVRAADTGRVLMLQRSLADEDDDAAGLWENPGGHTEPGETLLQAALREWAEETGCQVPRGTVTGTWDASNGIYRGFVLTVPSEDAVDIFGDRDEVWDPDDPHGDHTQAVAWWDPQQFAGNPSVRPEMQDDLRVVLAALGGSKAEKRAGGSAEVLRQYWTGEGHPGPTMFALEKKIRWGEPGDWYRCHDGVAPYLGAEGAKGYCNLRHHEVLGYWPAQHAEMEHGK